MKSVADDVKDMLVTAGYVHKTNLFVAAQPPTPINCITVFDSGGASPSNTLDGSVTYNDTFQVIVRNADYVTGWGIAYNIMQVLHNRYNETINTSRYVLIQLRGGVGVFQNTDSLDFSINFEAKRESI